MSFENKGSSAPTVIVSLEPDRSGNFVCSGAADDVEIQAAIDYVYGLGKGATVFIRRGTYTLANPLVIQNDSRIRVVGDSWDTILTGPAGDNVIELGDSGSGYSGESMRTTRILLQDLMLDGGSTGTGIYANISEQISKIHLNRIRISALNGIEMWDPYRCHWSDVSIRSQWADGIGINFQHGRDAFNSGDSYFDNIQTETTGDTDVGILIDATSGGVTGALNLMKFDVVRIYGATTGIHLIGSNASYGYIQMIEFHTVDIENAGTCALLDGTNKGVNMCIFAGPGYWSGTTGWEALGGVGNCVVRDLEFNMSGVDFDEDSKSTPANDPNYFIRINGATSVNFDGFSPTIIQYCSDYVTRNDGVATVVNGTTAIAVAHGIARTPDTGEIMVTPIEDLGAATYWWVDTVGAANFTINVDANPGQDVDFAWKVNSERKR